MALSMEAPQQERWWQNIYVRAFALHPMASVVTALVAFLLANSSTGNTGIPAMLIGASSGTIATMVMIYRRGGMPWFSRWALTIGCAVSSAALIWATAVVLLISLFVIGCPHDGSACMD